MADGVTFVLVGHCGPDVFMLRSAIEGTVAGSSVLAANDADAVDSAPSDAVLLVNRVLDGAFGDTDGVALVGRLAASGARAMLISNLPEAHEAAESRGGLPGFGKRELRSERMRACLERAAAAT